MIYTLCPFCGARVEYLDKQPVAIHRHHWPQCQCGACVQYVGRYLEKGKVTWTAPNRVSVICEESEV